jgi:hypothetical protein
LKKNRKKEKMLHLICVFLFLSILILIPISISLSKKNQKQNENENTLKKLNRSVQFIKNQFEEKQEKQRKNKTNSRKKTKRGIVIVAGGYVYFTNAYILVAQLRNLGCKLPIEIWHRRNEKSIHEKKLWQKFSNVTYNCLEDKFGKEIPGKYTVKPVALKLSSFDELLLLDADNNVIRDPTYLFENEEFKKTGAVFWYDFWPNNKYSTCYQLLSKEQEEKIPLFTQESGQILLDKRKCEQALDLCVHLNIKWHEDLGKITIDNIPGIGDKDTYQISWLLTETPFYFIPYRTSGAGFKVKETGKVPQYYGNTMVQHDFDGEPIFFHKNFLKWHIQKKANIWTTFCHFKKQDDTENDIVEQGSWRMIGPSAQCSSFKNKFGSEMEEFSWKKLTELRKNSIYKNIVN